MEGRETAGVWIQESAIHGIERYAQRGLENLTKAKRTLGRTRKKKTTQSGPLTCEDPLVLSYMSEIATSMSLRRFRSTTELRIGI